MLEIIGLSAEVNQVHKEMLDAQPVTVSDLVARTGLTPEALVTALRQLADHGLVSPVSQAPLTFIANDPSLVLDTLLLRHEEELRRARSQLQEISERFRRTKAEREPIPAVEIVTGEEAILARIHQIQRGAQRELRLFDKPPYHDGPFQQNEAELKLLRRGGQVRVVYETLSVQVPARLSHLDEHLSAGEEARVLPHLPAKMVIADDRLAFLPIHQADTVDGNSYSLIIHPSALLDALGHLFETLWQLALPFGLISPGPPDLTANSQEPAAAEPDPMERRILGLMNAGLPDEAIARHLGLSLRTLQRRIRYLMHRLNAHTRYQLGAQAVTRGWELPGANRVRP